MEVFILKKEHLEKAGLPTNDYNRWIPGASKYNPEGVVAFYQILDYTQGIVPLGLKTCRTIPGSTMLLPSSLVDLMERVIIKSSVDELKEVLKERYGDDAWVYGTGFYIHYKEIKITNTTEKEHTIKDLVVYVAFDVDQYEDINRFTRIQGRRFTVTKRELMRDYFHSHLDQTYERSEFLNFCLGSGTILKNLVSGQSFKANPLTLFGFLHQIDAFVKWESLEGNPYRLIKDVVGESTESSFPGTMFPENGEGDEPRADSLSAITMAREVLLKLQSSDISAVVCFKTKAGIIYHLDMTPGVIEIVVEVLRGRGYVCEFDADNFLFLDNEGGVSGRIETFKEMPSLTNRNTGVVIYPTVIDAESEATNVIKVPPPSLIVQVVTEVNNLLNQASFVLNAREESKDTDTSRV